MGVRIHGHKLDPVELFGAADLLKACSAPAVGAVVLGVELCGGHGGGNIGRGAGREGGGVHRG